MKMPIETWFPLAIYYEDLPDGSRHRQRMIEAVLELEQEGIEPQNYAEMAWTGDIHGVNQIHTHAAFRWIVEQVEEHTTRYLENIGVDLSKVDLYIQRGWPIISRSAQEVWAHCHNTAHVSAVYYIQVPRDEKSDPGSLLFFNDARVNEVCPGLGSENTDIVDAENELNQLYVAYRPVEGRLLIFPAKQRHAVSINETEEIRLSLSFDIVLTAKEEVAGAYEFLSPPPNQWKKFKTEP